MRTQSSRFVFYVVSVLCFVALLGCTSEQAIKDTLEKNPSIILKAMEKDPQAFAESMQRVSDAHRRMVEEKALQARNQELALELKSPKKPLISAERAVLGNRDAEIFVVAYTDFQCPYCQRGYSTVEELRQKYGSRVGFLLKHLPLEFHPAALPAAKRFEAIALQSAAKAYKFHDIVFQNQNKMTGDGVKFLDDSAKKAGADVARMKIDMESEVVKRRIQSDMEEARNFGISGTPGFVINGVTLKGAYPISAFEEIVEKTTKVTN